ncbi:hypothetical protein [Desulfospira joergensenii]|uniref:hypothetical protein n=1 Tax=Desulfospira joergensenii TaxID=53329 RepID=UPI001ABEEF50|nr:hypothetical protein [Desulfospira joergensenii]
MGKETNKARKKETMGRIRIVQSILRRWDPMDLAPGDFAPADEYDSYAPHIVSVVARGCPVEDLSAHLRKLRKGMVCMGDNPKLDMEIAGEIMAALRSEGLDNS